MDMQKGVEELVDLAPGNAGALFFGTKRLLRQANHWYPSGNPRKHLAAEFLGSILLHFLGATCVINSLDLTLNGTKYADHHGQTGLLISALGNGFATAALMYCFGGDNGSGGKLNPAISTGLFVAKRLRTLTFASEMAVQFIGAAVGGLLVRCVVPESYLEALEGDRATFQVVGALTDQSAWRLFLWESLSTASVVFVYFATAVDRHNLVYTRTMFPLAVGLAVTAGTLSCGPFVGVCMNPARAVAAAVAYWDISGLWLYLGAGVVGGILGAGMHLRLFLGDPNAPMLTAGSAFEGVRMERKEYQGQNFVQFITVDAVKRDAQDPYLFHWEGRVCYPELAKSTCGIKGVLSLDGRVVRFTEEGGHFDGAVSHCYMQDTGHLAGVQSHANGVPLANIHAVLLRRAAARRILAQLDHPPQDDDDIWGPGRFGDGGTPVPQAPPNTSRAHHSLV